jgi:murein DD-endopeptidase MepM/ murein hydrolase activator NlpD
VARTHYDISANTDQAYAVDLIVDAATPSATPGRANSEFPSYGQTIVADGPGAVTAVVDGIPDSAVPNGNTGQPYGNYVIIDHFNGEYSLFAHIRPGSLRVRQGDLVAAGQALGQCGNSGNSSMPHLHYQMMDKPNQTQARGVAIRHLPYLKNGASTTGRMEANDVVEQR